MDYAVQLLSSPSRVSGEGVSGALSAWEHSAFTGAAKES